jgi:hypothetical protein
MIPCYCAYVAIAVSAPRGACACGVMKLDVDFWLAKCLASKLLSRSLGHHGEDWVYDPSAQTRSNEALRFAACFSKVQLSSALKTAFSILNPRPSVFDRFLRHHGGMGDRALQPHTRKRRPPPHLLPLKRCPPHLPAGPAVQGRVGAGPEPPVADVAAPLPGRALPIEAARLRLAPDWTW